MNIIKLFSDKKAATAIEYGLIAALISIVIIAGLSLVGDQTTNMYSDISSTIEDATP